MQLRLNLDQVIEIVRVGVRRASSFIALGLRVSDDQAVKSVALDGNFQIQFMPTDLPIEGVREVQRNFRPWIIGNGLRELDQATSIFADKIYEARALLQFQNRGVEQDALDRIQRFKDRTNVASKLRLIAEEFGLDTDIRTHMAGLSQARNALSHNMGFIGQRHCSEEGALRLSWIGFEIVVGDRVIAAEFEPVRVERGDVLQVRTSKRARTLACGAPIELSPHDLHEICLTYLVQAQKLTRELENQMREMGIIQG